MMTARIFTCPKCNKPFKSKTGMDDHIRAKHRHSDAPELIRAPSCLECGQQASLVSGREIYPHRPDLYDLPYYRCVCGAYCGCHPGTTRPLGHPAGTMTRKARDRAHSAFDPIWKDKPTYGMTRHNAYKMLAEALGIPASECHIGMMNTDSARRVEKFSYKWRAEFHGEERNGDET